MLDLRPLPPQLIGPVACYADRAVLPTLARVSRIFNSETVRVLYRSVSLRHEDEATTFNRTICEQDSLARLVVALDVDLEATSCKINLRVLAHLRHLSFAIVHAYTDLKPLVRVPSDALLSLTLRSPKILFRAQTDTIARALGRQRRLTHFGLACITYVGVKINTEDLPALASLDSTDYLTVFNVAPGRPLRRVHIHAFMTSYQLASFLSVCPRGVQTLHVGLYGDIMSGLRAIAAALGNLDALSIKYDGLQCLGDVLQVVAAAEQLPPFGHLRLLSISHNFEQPIDENLCEFCSTILHRWKNGPAPNLERVTASSSECLTDDQWYRA